MKRFQRIRRSLIHILLPLFFGAMVSVALAPSLLASKPSSTRRQRAKIAFDKAEKMRADLTGIPLASRKRADYEHVVTAYRTVYSSDPSSPYADDALLAVAELHDQLAGDLKKPEYFRKAIEDYEFLITEYPYSKLNKDALFTIGLIYQNDIGDNQAALNTFQEYLKKYKQGPKIIAARENIRQLKQKMEKGEKASAVAELPTSAPKPSDTDEEQGAGKLVDFSKLPRVTNIRHYSTSNYTRVVIDVEGEIQYDQSQLRNPDRIFFDLKGTRLSSTLLGKSFPVEDGFLKEVRAAQFQPNVVRIVLDLDTVRDYTVFPLYNPYRLVIDIRGANPPSEKTVVTAEKTVPPKAPAETASAGTTEKQAKKEERPATIQPTPKEKPEESKTAENKEVSPPEESAASKPAPRATLPKAKTKDAESPAVLTPHAAKPSSDGSLSLTRSLGLKIGRIVIDPGHGGHDFGTIGPGGLAEKDLALDVSLRLGKLLEEKLNSQVVYTRDDDTFVPLENRTALANQKQADLFISIHANSSRNRSASGVETFYLGIASQHDQETLDVVARENAYSERSLHDLQDVIKKITLNEKVEESKEFAASVQRSVISQTSKFDQRAKNRGVKKAHFIVLIGANMPSVLCEISFLSNPADERLLKKPEYRQKIAQALYDGIYNYVRSLSGVKVAKKLGGED